MLVRYFVGGVSYLIEAPVGSWVDRLSDRPGSMGDFLADRLVIPWEGREVPIPTEPPGVLSMLAEEGYYGLRLVAGPMPPGAGQTAPRG